MVRDSSTMLKGLFLSLVLTNFVPSIRAQDCSSLPQAVIDDIQSYQGVVNQIIDLFVDGSFNGRTYHNIALLTDTYGSRLAGSTALEDSIDWIMQESTNAGFDSVYTEDVTIPYWIRNDGSLAMTSPRQESLPFLSFGSSVATPAGGIEADVLVVSDFADLDLNAASVPGKIVIYDVPFTSYNDHIGYLSDGADAASQYGAVATLVRSMTDLSINSLHAGETAYNGLVPQIPTGAITVEDATMLHRMQDRGDAVRVNLNTNAEALPDTTSRNLIIDLTGAVDPSEVVVVSGHLDSWDVGEGVIDDAGGCVISWMAGMALMNLSLTPRRTIRTIMFTGGEIGLVGGDAYYAAHSSEVDSFQIMLESDGGLFDPYGITFSGNQEATCMMQEVLKLMSNLNSTLLTNGVGAWDLGGFIGAGVPTGVPIVNGERYFWFHHSEGDSMAAVDRGEIDECAALWTAVAYVTADMTYRLPIDLRKNNP